MKRLMHDKKLPLILLCLTASTLLAFWQVHQCDFLNYDDDLFVTENRIVQNGLSLDGIGWAFTTFHFGNWHPLTWLSHMLDVQLFGLNPRGHHLTNLLFHIANTLLLFSILHRMTQSPWRSGFVAALFALHPLHVQSVAWVAERKDLLSTCFWMLTMGAYLAYVKRPEPWRYLAVVVLFTLGLMAKSMLVTLPFVLLLLDYWPLHRFGRKTIPVEIRDKAVKPSSTAKRNARQGRKPIAMEDPGEGKPGRPEAFGGPWACLWPLIGEKIPLFVLTAIFCVVTYIAQQQAGGVRSFALFPMSVRIWNAFVSYMLYIAKTVWPSDLAVLYPHPVVWPLWQVLISVGLFVIVTFVAIRWATRFPYVTVGWFWYTGTLVPVIGLVQIGGHALADRFTYVPLIGLFIMAAWGIPELLKGWRFRKEALAAASALILLGLIPVTWKQVGYWQNSITLYDHTLSVTRQNSHIYNNRGIAYHRLGNPARAIQDYNQAIEIDPEFAEHYNNRGLAYSSLGNLTRAMEDYNRAIEIDPGYAMAYSNRGIAYQKLGNPTLAIRDYDRAIEIDPTNAKPFNNRGASYLSLGNPGRAIQDYDRAIEIDRNYAMAYHNRGIAYGHLGHHEKAMEDLISAARLGSESAKTVLRNNKINW